MPDTEYQIRKLSRDSLKGKYKTAIPAGILTSLLGVSVTGLYFGIGTVFNIVSNFFNIHRYTSVDSRTSLYEVVNDQVKEWTTVDIVSYMSAHWVPLLIVCVLVLILSIVIVGGITLGYAKMNLTIADRSDVRFRDLFSQMRKKRNMTGLKLVFFRAILIGLGRIVGAAIGAFLAIVVYSVLYLIAPGFDKSVLPGTITFFSATGMLGGDIFVRIRYAFAPYILCDDPELKPADALDRSSHLLNGRKNLFLSLVLSFLGWFALDIVTFGLASLWVRPYYEATIANFYRIVLRNYERDNPIVP